MIGLTEQLVGQTQFNAPEFAYCGSIGPLTIEPKIREELKRIGAAVAREFEMRGIFGLDAIVKNDRVSLLEINPRFPASAEIFDSHFAINQPSVVQLHVSACMNGELPPQTRFDESAFQIPKAGKAFLFSPFADDFRLDSHLLEQLAGFRIADIPTSESVVTHGAPILTLLAEAKNEQEVMNRLRSDSKTIYGLIESRLYSKPEN